jgi:hypothetical protein
MPEGLQLEGLIVVVGPNSSGKTNLLKDIHAAASGLPRDFVVAAEIGLRKAVTGVEDYINYYRETGDIEPIPPQPNTYRIRGHQIGMQTGGGTNFGHHDIQGWFNQMASHTSTPLNGSSRPNQFLSQIGLLECAALFLQQRLALTDSAPHFDTHQTPPIMAVQALRLNQGAQRKFSDEMYKTFRRRMWVDVSGGPTVPIRVSDSGEAPSAEDRSMPDKVRSYRIIESEGDGIRSYAAVCVALLLFQRTLYLIDEPEMCLHPPQAREIGRFIGEQAKAVKGCVMIATHSSQVLRGILQANQNVTVIRLTRNKAAFRAQHVSSEVLNKATRKPFSRSEVTLDGLFSDGVVLCESDGDRVVYESALNTLPPGPDIRWTPVGGIGGFAELTRLYRALGVPVAIAADFDLLLKGELKEVLDSLGTAVDEIAELIGRRDNLVKKIRETKPELSPEAVISDLSPLLKDAETWDLKKEAEIRSQINRLLQRLNRFAGVKSEGIAGVPEDLKEEALGLLEKCKCTGLYLVPQGELESWVAHLMGNSISKVNKTVWATEAARKIEEAGRGLNDVWDYVEGIATYFVSILEKK